MQRKFLLERIKLHLHFSPQSKINRKFHTNKSKFVIQKYMPKSEDSNCTYILTTPLQDISPAPQPAHGPF